jgi:hypothetical protein
VTGNIAAAASVLLIYVIAVGLLWAVPRHQGLVVFGLALVVLAVWVWVPPVRDILTSHTPGMLVGIALGLGLVAAYRWHEGRQRRITGPQ